MTHFSVFELKEEARKAAILQFREELSKRGDYDSLKKFEDFLEAEVSDNAQ